MIKSYRTEELNVDIPDNGGSPGDPSPPASPNCLPVGTRLDDFEITGIVGEGGFGIVYLAFDHSLRRTVAIKEYMPGALAGRATDNSVTIRSKRHEDTFKTGLRSFINEARLLAKFDHPALVKVYRFWEQNSTGYMAMRYYDGQTLGNVIKNNPGFITEAWLKSMLKSILEALDALYKEQILHRDISPDNIVIQQNGEAVLLDFGAARQIISDMSHALTVILKPGYAPVEQYADDATMAQGPWTDIYALSAVVYYAIVKKPPPTSVTRMIKDPIEPLADGNHPGYSPAFLAAIDRGLGVRPENRPQSMDQFRALLGIAIPSPAHPSPLPLPVRPVPADSSEHTILMAPPITLSKAQTELPTASTTHMHPAAPISQPAAVIGQPEKRSNPIVPVIAGIAIAVLVAAAYGGYRYINQGSASAADQTIRASAGSPPTAALPAIPSAGSVPPAATASDGLPVHPTVAASSPAVSIPATDNPAEIKPATVNPEAEKPTGMVKLSIKPWGTIIVDGDTKGVSPPLKRLRLLEGKHQVRVVNPNFSDYEMEIEVDKKKSSSIEYDFSSGTKATPPR